MKKDDNSLSVATVKGGSAPSYFIEKPIFPNTVRDDFFKMMDDIDCQKFYESANIPDYIYWDKLKYKIPKTAKFTQEQTWFFIAQSRKFSSTRTVIKTENGKFFRWTRLFSTDEALHTIDMFAGGRLFNKSDKLSNSKNQTYLSRGLIEEAIASSQLEGAHTTRKAAREMLIQNRAPHNESEQMIVNNYKTISAIQENYKDKKLDLDLLFEMHAMISDKTVSDTEQHRLRKDSDNIVVQGYIGAEEYVTHVPPTADFLNKNIQSLIDYANDEDEKNFTHPIIKAIFIHFWIGYLHPFTDGNGRLARALFYWYLLRKEYWSFMYLPISTIIKKAPNQYAMAYIYAEQDDLDITYFYDFHIKKILQAIKEFGDFLDEKIDENKLVEKNISSKYSLNDRQKQLIYYLISDAHPSVSIHSHTTLHNISRPTASKDLMTLVDADLLVGKRSGRIIKYFPTKKLLNEIGTAVD